MAAINSTSAKFNSSSSTSSSDSSSGIGGFSSSDTESLYGSSKSKSVPTLKPIKTNLNQPEFHRKSYSDEIPAKKKGNKEGNLQKRALKLYGDLKKVKQPISPGGKLASFLNSLFNSNSSKKPKISSSSANVLKYSTSTPSTASSYSRSCLSKTPSSAGRFERRSVRFCPVSTVIATTTAATNDDKVYNDGKREDRWREKATTRNSSTLKNDEFKVQISEKQRRVEEVAKELLKNYHHGRKYQNDEVGSDHHRMYREELPVYETTHVHTNRAIANGLIL
uniref:Uncharacterized protein n=1 Tax=Chenopodium quinoa TaxID=63459 RepID=A0A803LDD4_CHEQI